MERRGKGKEEMASFVKNLKVYVRRCPVILFKIGHRFAKDHPFIFGMVIFLCILRRYWPSLFVFLVSSSPVFVCTALLLGTLLVYGEPNIPENKVARVRNRTKVKEKKVKDTGKKRSSASVRAVGDAPLMAVRGKCVEKSDTVSAGRSLVVEGNQGFHKKREVSKGKHAEGSVKVSEAGGSTRTNKSGLKSRFDSSLEGRDGSSGSESDVAENSSPDASVSDFIPMLDELHPLLESEAPQPAHMLVDNSDAASSRTSQGNESDDDSVEEEEEEEEEEVQEEKDDTIEAVVTWTADDEKNLMDLGSSELERNQRMENLIAKRRARKFLSFHAEKNLIDLDSNDPMPNTVDLSCFQYQIPSISAPRHNPFDLPFDTEDSMGLPPIPGSAPSVLQPRRNPFELPLYQVEESDNLPRERMNHQEFAPVSQREMFYRRHESFSLGASFTLDCKEDSQDSVFKPYFVPERKVLEGVIEKSDSKVSSAHESGSNSSIIDQDDHKERLEDFNLVNHLPSPEKHYVESVEHGSHSSDELDDERRNVDDGHAIQLNSATVLKGNYRAVDAFGAVEMEIRQGESLSPDSHAGNLEVIEEKYDVSSSSSSEARDKSSKNDLKDRNAIGRRDDSQAVDPVYDSSPSSVEKCLSNMPKFDEPLLHTGKEFSSNNSVAPDFQLGSSEVGSPLTSHDKKVSSGESGFASVSRSMSKHLSSGTAEIWVAPPSLASVDEIESRSREVTEIRERDVIRPGLVVEEDFGHPIAPVLPEVMLPSHLSAVNNDSLKDIAVEADEMTNSAASPNLSESRLSYTAQEMPVIQQSEIVGLKDSDIATLDVSPVHRNSLPEFDVTTDVSPINRNSPREFYVTSDVSPVHRTSPLESRVGKEHDNIIHPPANPSSLSGLQEVEELEVGLSGKGEKSQAEASGKKEKSHSEGSGKGEKSNSSFKIGKIKNIKKFW